MERRKKGLLPANIILTRDASIEVPELKKFKKFASIAYMPLEIGISKATGMETFSFSYPEMKDYDVYQNLYDGLKEAVNFSIKILKKEEKNFNYFYIHFKETDIPGHDNKPYEKKTMIEFLDKEFFSFLKKFSEKNKIKLIITADHSTPCNLKTHSSDPVPLLYVNWQESKNKEFSESEAKKGELKKIYGRDVLKMFIE